MIHTVRVVPLDGRAPLRENIDQWSGDSRGRWEGDTLVVETTNFNGKSQWKNSTGNMTLVERITRVDHKLHREGSRERCRKRRHRIRRRRTSCGRVVERLTRIDADTIDYRVTVTNPTVWTGPWTAAMPMRAMEETLFEYACHEGNRSVPNMLSGNRAEEEAEAVGSR